MAKLKPDLNMRVATVFLAVILAATPVLAKAPQVLPDKMFGNLFSLTQAASVLKMCENSDAWGDLPDDKKELLKRLTGKIDDLVRKIARKFDSDVFEFYVQQRDETARDPDLIKHYTKQYGICGDTMFDRMRWYVYDSRQKLDQFLMDQPDVQ